MRLLDLYVVVDTKAGTLIGPVVHDHSAVPIIRQISEAANKPGTLISNNPEDFEIRHIGQIDEQTGHLYLREVAEHQQIEGSTYTIGLIRTVTTALALKQAQA